MCTSPASQRPRGPEWRGGGYPHRKPVQEGKLVVESETLQQPIPKAFELLQTPGSLWGQRLSPPPPAASAAKFPTPREPRQD